MTTALDMLPAIGAQVSVRCEQMQIACTVKNVKNSWGKPRLLVTPVAGSGEQWVEMERVSVPREADDSDDQTSVDYRPSEFDMQGLRALTGRKNHQ